MRKLSIITLLAIVLAIVSFCWVSTPFAADEALTFKPSSVTVSKDRNGQEYVRMIYGETRELNGIKYSTGASVNAYGENVAAAKKFKAGDTVSCVVSKKNYNGTIYYTVLAFAPTAPAKK
jgi:hypothetical protein